LIIPCEVAVKSVVPAVKAYLAKELVEKHGLKQNEVAELLGISQSAVSKYTREVRGYVIRIDNVEEIQVHIDSMVSLVTGGKGQRTELLNLFCQTCEVVRRKRLMCKFCQRTEPRIKIEECTLCFGPDRGESKR